MDRSKIINPDLKIGVKKYHSKYKTQQFILNEVKENKLPAIILNPTFMFGPYDSNPSSGAMIVALYKGKVPGYTSGGRNYICAKDAATATESEPPPDAATGAAAIAAATMAARAATAEAEKATAALAAAGPKTMETMKTATAITAEAKATMSRQ